MKKRIHEKLRSMAYLHGIPHKGHAHSLQHIGTPDHSKCLRKHTHHGAGKNRMKLLRSKIAS